MAGMGPVPKPDGARRRRNATVASTKLPAEGRQGPPPEFPLPKARGGAAARETQLWAGLWATPQAVMWERQGWTRVVARYTRLLALAEAGNLEVAKEARMLEDRLGLNPMSMLRLRWEIVPDELADQRHARGQSRPRPRLSAVDPDAVAGS